LAFRVVLTCWSYGLDQDSYAQYTPPTRRNCRVASRRGGVNTPVGSRELGHGRRLRCVFASPNPSAVVANSCTHRRRRREATKHAVSSRRRRRCVLGFRWATVCGLVKTILLYVVLTSHSWVATQPIPSVGRWDSD